MKKLKKTILQSIADYIIKKLESEMDYVTIDDKIFYFYWELGMWLDFYSLEYFGVELE
jgi:hypothetical protein